MNKNHVINQVMKLGITYDDASALRRIAMQLHRWAELCCGTDRGCVERDEDTGKVYFYDSFTGKRHKTRDLETGALKRLQEVLSRYPELEAYEQGDPRGAPLYIYRKEDLGNRDIDSVYNSVGIAVYK